MNAAAVPVTSKSALATYAPRPIKRERRTQSEMNVIIDGLYAILEEAHPMSVRQVFYQATTHGLVGKTEAEYKGTVIRLLSKLRRYKLIPFDWITDNTRWMRKPTTHDSMEAALAETARFYRRSLWADTDVTVEVWLEKDALSGVLYDVTATYDVPLMVTRGYPSLSFLQSAAEAFEVDGREVYIYYFGDWDPSGLDISRVVERDLRELAPNVNITFERVAVTEVQIKRWNLPTRPTKKTDTRAKTFKGDSVEVDAIPSEDLRLLASMCIEEHIDRRQLEELRNIEVQERETLSHFAQTFRRSAGGGAA